MKLKWTVEFSVDESWVAAGFDLTKERAHEMLATDLAGAHNHEILTKIVKAPDPDHIATLQGYANAKEMRARNQSVYG